MTTGWREQARISIALKGKCMNGFSAVHPSWVRESIQDRDIGIGANRVTYASWSGHLLHQAAHAMMEAIQVFQRKPHVPPPNLSADGSPAWWATFCERHANHFIRK